MLPAKTNEQNAKRPGQGVAPSGERENGIDSVHRYIELVLLRALSASRSFALGS